ncbi:MAG TPA: magnesium transporter [Chloroflexi bacterium]|nr:magnesium transporter [Chloroflexota bacterium]|tara:strand:- start:779 stop:2128 length:1350 start_codon:yes stop_codon:yes gene_type:complete
MKTNLESTLNNIQNALDNSDIDLAQQLLNTLHPADQADAISDRTLQEQSKMLPHLTADNAAAVLEHLDEDEAANIASELPLDILANLLDKMEPDEAADILLDLYEDKASQVLKQMSSSEIILPLLKHRDDTAGGRMTTQIPTLYPEMTTSHCITYLRKSKPDKEHHYYLYVIDQNNTLLGILGLRELITNPPNTQIKDIMNNDFISASVDDDQEKCARLISHYNLMSLPIVNDQTQLLGVITYDDIVEVIEDEATEDIYALSNLSADSDLDVFSPVKMMISKRLPWLYVNLFGAFISAYVISKFEPTIAKIAFLAIFQSIVAGLGGNAGTQSLAIMVRALALKQLTFRQVWKALGRELVIGSLNGLAVGISCAILVYFWRGNTALGLIIGIATFGNLLIAGLLGTIIPLTLKYFRQDPALASSALVTGITDIIGFALFLSLATLYISYL